ncbi:MAG: asparagine synthase (glutamine-hydrolyzing) [Sandaracinaceae bacterium]|nr:asparagine synthase (glutamine-hydrolyzing) [Sandaracinaceae bacterium]
MCGIGGSWGPGESADVLEALAAQMQALLHHRGPDAHGAFVEPGAGLVLVHTRLSIRDLTPTGAQPMRSADGRYTIVYNGELYGTDGLRRELEAGGCRLRGHSDTEVLLEAIARHGVLAALGRVSGIFAFAVWDANERNLWLVRDRVGIKPLYVAPGIGGRSVAFSSELAGLEGVSGLTLDPDPTAAHAFFELGYVPDTQAVFRGVHKVQPGEAWCFTAPGVAPRVNTYCDREADVLAGQGSLLCRPGEACSTLTSTLTDVVASQLVSDVPVGVFLSGGVDSSVVAAAATRARGKGVRTFCIGFDDPRYDESATARAIAKHLGTVHHQLILRPEDVVGAAVATSTAFSEPFADSSMVPTWLLCRFARQHVTVVLSGDGGDELFGGYNRHVWLPRVMRAQRLLPPLARRMFAAAVTSVRSDAWDHVMRPLPVRTPGLKLHKLGRLLAAPDPEGMLREVVSTGPLARGLVLGRPSARPTANLGLDDPRAELMFKDFTTYLPGDILPKVDRTSMFHGLEARVPLLDDRVVRLAARIDPSLKVHKGQSKWILREVLAQSVPRAMFERPKMGFAIPLGDWLRGPLRPWAEELLSPQALAHSPLLDASVARTAWRDLLKGRPMMEFGVWSLLMWQTWEQQRRSRARVAA